MNKGVKAFMGIVSITPILFLFGMALSLFIYLEFPFKIVQTPGAVNIFMEVGIALVLLGTILAFLSQKVSRNASRPHVKATVEGLMRGPYKYSRHPGALSLIIMYVGFVMVTNSLILLFLAIVFIALLTFVFVPIEEKVILGLAPEAYAEYKTKVRMWF